MTAITTRWNKGNADQRKASRGVLREFHPDKNPTRAIEAKEYYQMLLQHIEKQEFTPIEQLYKTLTEQGSEAACDKSSVCNVKRMQALAMDCPSKNPNLT